MLLPLSVCLLAAWVTQKIVDEFLWNNWRVWLATSGSILRIFWTPQHSPPLPFRPLPSARSIAFSQRTLTTGYVRCNFLKLFNSFRIVTNEFTLCFVDNKPQLSCLLPDCLKVTNQRTSMSPPTVTYLLGNRVPAAVYVTSVLTKSLWQPFVQL